MNQLLQIAAGWMEKYAGSSHLVMWTAFIQNGSPVYNLILQNHPEPTRHLNLYFFTRLNWIEVHREQQSLNDDTDVMEVSIIDINENSKWQVEVEAVIESWLEYVDGKPADPASRS